MSPETKATPPQFHFTALFIVKAHYEYLEGKAVLPVATPPKINVNLEMSASILLNSEGKTALVKLETAVIPDQEIQPYQINITVAGTFATMEGSAEDLVGFCKMAAPAILFPYIRETAHRLTMDAPNGVVRLDPFNVSGMLNANEWTIARSAESAPTANEQQQPSSLSPSAS